MLNSHSSSEKKLSFLREKHKVFSFESSTWTKRKDSLDISFYFKISPDTEFHPSITINNLKNSSLEKIDNDVLENFIFHLGLVEMISYWKATCSPIIEIKAGVLEQEQIDWWKNLILKGLGEFFYENHINFKQRNFLEIKNHAKNKFFKDDEKHKDRFLVLNGGGRDSVVLLETVKELKKGATVLMLNPTKASLNVQRISGIKNKIIVIREIDKNLLALNNSGYLNGHTPFSAYLAFLSELCALLLDRKTILSGNERSSNEVNVEFLGEKINHQFSKSFEFEKSFREYVKSYLSKDLEYISLLRPLYEIQISKIFSSYYKYFKSFKSCNRGQKNNEWCGTCPKCLSVFISLYPFIQKTELIEIFGGNLYEDENLLDLLQHLTGEKKPKPFECVGTHQEVLAGLALSIKERGKFKKELPPLLKYAKQYLVQKKVSPKVFLKEWDIRNFLTKEMVSHLRKKAFL